jgi:magnesium transporter
MINILAEQSSHSFDWIDVENPSVQELQEIASRYGLHQSSVEDCLDPDHLPKYEEIEDTFFIVLRVFDPQSKPDSDTIQEVSRKISIFHSGKQLITIHRSPQPFLTHLKAKYVDTHKAENELQLLCAIVQKVLMSYEDPADKLSAEIDFYESKIFLKSRTPDLLKSLYRIKRKSSVIRRILILSKDILNRLEGKKIKGTVIRELHDRYLMIDMSYDQIWENERGDPGAYHFLGVLYAAYVHCRHLRDEFPLDAGIAMAIRVPGIHSCHDADHRGDLYVVQAQGLAIEAWIIYPGSCGSALF